MLFYDRPDDPGPHGGTDGSRFAPPWKSGVDENMMGWKLGLARGRMCSTSWFDENPVGWKLHAPPHGATRMGCSVRTWWDGSY